MGLGDDHSSKIEVRNFFVMELHLSDLTCEQQGIYSRHDDHHYSLFWVPREEYAVIISYKTKGSLNERTHLKNNDEFLLIIRTSAFGLIPFDSKSLTIFFWLFTI